MEDVEDCNEEDLVVLDDAVASNEETVEDGTQEPAGEIWEQRRQQLIAGHKETDRETITQGGTLIRYLTLAKLVLVYANWQDRA
ncbi:unnamed protein product [Sphagnum jensenii]|uniref:Uncharacterized protein n=1 Tax=Sphagnum jensenii TaxID=128206 RepID=A0ABP1ACV4_9BRYO